VNTAGHHALIGRRAFLQQFSILTAAVIPYFPMDLIVNSKRMKEKFDVIIVGGSYAGLSVAMALGRALREVLIIDGGKPANRFTPYSHNFITHDGKRPDEIATLARQQVEKYPSVKQIQGFVVSAEKVDQEFIVGLDSGTQFASTKLIFATGVVDLMPAIPGFTDCWGKSVLHCPYCHGYEVRNTKTGILGNGDYAFEFGSLISNWTRELVIFTNGPATLNAEQKATLDRHRIPVIEHRIQAFHHDQGYLKSILFENGHSIMVSTIYARPEFKQHTNLPAQLGCELTPEGYIKIDSSHRTTVPGVYACGDNVTRLRTVSNAVAMGTVAGMMANKDLVTETF
jgi:thioredoxin reductase